jgi:hypothetical protein
MAIKVHCVKIGKKGNQVGCYAVDDDGGGWFGKCTKHKNGTWSCVQVAAMPRTAKGKLRKVPPQLVKALLDVKGRR